MSNFKVGDEVEVTGDYRRYLNGLRGVITEINGDRARVKLDHIGRSDSADVYLVNLRKIEEGPSDGKE
jgi:transcription antitermination factor NusG